MRAQNVLSTDDTDFTDYSAPEDADLRSKNLRESAKSVDSVRRIPRFVVRPRSNWY
jgi:hypothetical protein